MEVKLHSSDTRGHMFSLQVPWFAPEPDVGHVCLLLPLLPLSCSHESAAV